MKKRGFTLVEIIMCVVLLVMIGAASIYFIGIKKDDDTITITEVEKELYEISDIYYTNNKNNNNFKYYENDDDFIVTCMRLETLVDEGLVSDDSPILTTYNNDDIFKYIINTTGSVTVEPIVDSSDKTCEYIIMETGGFVEIPDDDPTVNQYPINFRDAENKEWGANYDYSFLNGDISDYKGNISFDMRLKQLISVEQINPLYISIILDQTVSMKTNSRYSKALESINNFITYLNSLDSKVKQQIYLSGISFGESMMTSVDFEKISTINNYSKIGFPSTPKGPWTNCSSGLYQANELFKGVSDSNAVKVAIFLADGACNRPTNTTKAMEKATDASSLLASQDVEVFTIGYELGSSDEKNMKKIATTSKLCDLDDYNTETVCYFSATTSDINNLFKDLAITSVESSINNPYNKVEFSIKLAPYFEFVSTDLDDSVKYETGYNYRDSLDIDNNILKRTVNITDSNSFDILKISDFNYNVNFLKDVYRDLNSSLEVGGRSYVELDILSSLKIVMSGSGSSTPIELCSDSSKSCYSEDLPKVTIDLSKNSVIN